MERLCIAVCIITVGFAIASAFRYGSHQLLQAERVDGKTIAATEIAQ